jgi:hypothetical protein
MTNNINTNQAINPNNTHRRSREDEPIARRTRARAREQQSRLPDIHNDDHLSILPTEIKNNIISLLDTPSRGTLRSVNRTQRNNLPIEQHYNLEIPQASHEMLIRLAEHPNLHLMPDVANILANNRNGMCRASVAEHPNLHLMPDVANILANDRDEFVRASVANHPNLHLMPNIASILANDRDEFVRASVANNPNVQR